LKKSSGIFAIKLAKYYRQKSYHDHEDSYTEWNSISQSEVAELQARRKKNQLFTEGFMSIYVKYNQLKLSFGDEFNSDQLNLVKWSTKTPWGPLAISHGEMQHYVDTQNRPSNTVNPFDVSDGVLTISANETPSGFDAAGQPYTSGVISSHNSFKQHHGYFEMNAQLSPGSGFWSAFWMQPSGKSLPELDVVEASGKRPGEYFTNMHYAEDGDVFSGLNQMNFEDVDLTDGFHRYGLNWQEDKVQWFFDGKLVAEEDTPDGMDDPMFMMINLAVARGGWAGSVDESFNFPSEYKIDYIRAYTGDATPAVTETTPPDVVSTLGSKPEAASEDWLL
jgi:beta-glucanase (GH16 family)